MHFEVEAWCPILLVTLEGRGPLFLVTPKLREPVVLVAPKLQRATFPSRSKATKGYFS